MVRTPNQGRRRSAGRRKIDIKKIDQKSNLQVSFSKRRAGMFKKAGELCVLCGVQIAVIVKSPGNNFFSFGHPSVDAIVDQYLAGGPPPGSAAAHHTTDEYNRSYAAAFKEIEEERKKAPAVEEAKAAVYSGGGGFWWEAAIDGMGLEELEQFQASLTELKENLNARARAALSTGDENFLPLPNL
ncbi:agamous-like MADS-box protein AGL62 [Malania oleifera]|uniref:agamous-like MADS-box protein AGL62 n=1 Tax=Malania oleifera TaxID=397392 RepID=UPI0025AE1D7F|nr:agamous-like MADS-box protein AGL62 [Malania oleifera]